jgi:hypothetical protein
MAGQAVGLAEEIKPVNDLIKELIFDARQELIQVAGKLSGAPGI